MVLLATDTILQNRYRIVSLIAQGGMGAVYQAIDQRLGNTVALKQVIVTDTRLRESFEREARLLASLQHPVLPVVSDHFAEDQGEFLVMQYIPGDDLGMILTRANEPFSSVDVLRWADQLLDALEYLHGQNPPIIHRDIKPRNLKFTPRQDIILLDFGLARGAQRLRSGDGSSGVRILTPGYAPLEQIQGQEDDPRSDLYALAATVYHLLTGMPPSDSLTRAAAVLSEQTDPLRPANEINAQIPPAVAVILHQAMSHSLEQRFASATAMRTALSMVYKTGLTSINSEVLISSIGDTTVPITKKRQPEQQEESEVNKPVPATAMPVAIVSKQEDGHYTTIAEAITKARPGSRILVRPGLYREGLVIDRPLEIIGDGPVDDIFIESTDSPCLMMETDYALIRGITLRGRAGLSEKEYVTIDIPQGRMVLEDCNISSDTLACIAIHGAKANPIIWRCQIHDSKSIGISVSDHGQGIIEDCDIFSNAGAGLEIKKIGNPIVRRCKIHHGSRDGIIVAEKGVGVVEGCDIFGNGRAGIGIERGGNVLVRLCQIHDQVNGYGVYVYDKGEGTIEACNIFGNAKAGVGITQQGNPFIRRCKIHHERQRGVFIFESGEGTIEQSFILSNVDTGISIGAGSKPVIRRCQINHNGSHGIRVLAQGSGLVEDCDLTGNAVGAWDLAAKCSIRQNDNRE